jgi:broad specificity phosphatase PhoE
VDAGARLRELSDFAAPWSVWVAATLRLPDQLCDRALTADELAERCGADAGALRRLLAYLVGRGVFAEADGRYANTEVSELLLEEGGLRPWLDLDGAPGLWAESWTRLLTAIRTGSPGRDEAWFYDELARSGGGASFDALMAARVQATADELAAVYDWRGVAHVADIGGGTGRLLLTLLDAQPHLRGTLFDLPQVVVDVEPSARLAVVAGDFRSDPLPTADVHILSGVLHGWPDEEAAAILARSAEQAGRVLVIESPLTDPPSHQHAGFDLFMLTLVGGRERSIGDFRRLGDACGLTRCVETPLAAGHSIVELSR